MLAAAAIIGSSQSPPLNPGDFQALMQAAVAAGAASWTAPVQYICVQRELEAPLKFVKRASGLPWQTSPNGRFGPQPALDSLLAKAMSRQAVIAPEKLMPSLAPRFITFSTSAPRPKECVIDHDPGIAPTGPRNYSVAITMTRPAFMDGMAFISEVDDCPGLCGDGMVRVFRKQDGKWTQVADANLWVS